MKRLIAVLASAVALAAGAAPTAGAFPSDPDLLVLDSGLKGGGGPIDDIPDGLKGGG
jgi:hypothetical protein